MQEMAAVHFPNGCLLKDRRKAGGRFVYYAKITHHLVILCSLYSVIFN